MRCDANHSQFQLLKLLLSRLLYNIIGMLRECRRRMKHHVGDVPRLSHRHKSTQRMLLYMHFIIESYRLVVASILFPVEQSAQPIMKKEKSKVLSDGEIKR